MAIPASTLVWSETLDPYDITDYEVDCTEILEPLESIDTFEIYITPEAALLGLTLGTGAREASVDETGKIIRLWLSVDEDEYLNASFNAGVVLPIEVNITTDSTPSRRKQRTVAVRVIQR